MDPIVATEVAKAADGVPFRAKTGYYHSTWAKTFISRPELYLQPESLPEIEKIVNLARKCGRRVTATGSTHSPSTLTLTSSWLLNLDKYNRVLFADQSTGIVVLQSGIRLFDLAEELDKLGLAMPNLGSINEQSIAGAISTGTHGSSLHYGLLSEDVLALRITLADGTTKSCSPQEEPELFRASLLSLGALGIITEVTYRAVPAFSLRWKQTIDSDAKMLSRWDKDLWTQAEYTRVWWYPHTRRAVTWAASKTTDTHFDNVSSYFDGAIGYQIYHNLLYLGEFVPRLLPWVEWFITGMQFGFTNGSSTEAVQPSRKALLLNCLYSQYVNEWAIPLHKGPEFLGRFSSWLNHLKPADRGYVPHNIPFSASGVYAHTPVEVRVTNTSKSNPRASAPNSRPYLDPTVEDEPTLYINAVLYRPHHKDPHCRARYYEAFEWLMREMGGRPHWAKNFESDGGYLEKAYGSNLEAWRKVRESVDPKGMFVGAWHRRHVLGRGPSLALEEVEVKRSNLRSGGVVVDSDYGPLQESRMSTEHAEHLELPRDD